MRITLAQLNPLVGDVTGNVRRISDVMALCAADQPDLIVFPELFLVGYPPKDLLERAWFIRRVQQAVDDLARLTAQYPNTGILFGAVSYTHPTLPTIYSV